VARLSLEAAAAQDEAAAAREEAAAARAQAGAEAARAAEESRVLQAGTAGLRRQLRDFQLYR